MQSVYDAAGGDDGLRRLASAWHDRVLADEVVSHAFHQGTKPDHTERLAAYWAEALGGPATYSERYGDETSVVRIHSGNGPHEEMDERAIACFDQALVDVGLAGDARIRDVLHDYFAWATTTTMSRYHRSADDVPDGLRIPHWSWDGLVGLRLGIAHHFGWAVAITASADHEVVDRRRIDLIEPGLPAAPIHHEGGPHLLHRRTEPFDDGALEALVAQVRASVVRTTSAALDDLATALPEPIVSMSLRAWPTEFPDDVAVQRRVPYESRADSVMYAQVLAELAGDRGWTVHVYNAKHVEDDAIRMLGERADDVLRGPRARLGPPWSKDHRMALAATIALG